MGYESITGFVQMDANITNTQVSDIWSWIRMPAEKMTEFISRSIPISISLTLLTLFFSFLILFLAVKFGKGIIKIILILLGIILLISVVTSIILMIMH